MRYLQQFLLMLDLEYLYTFYTFTFFLVSMTEEVCVRPDWDTYFMDLARTVAERSTCDRGRSGCVITRDNRLLVT